MFSILDSHLLCMLCSLRVWSQSFNAQQRLQLNSTGLEEVGEETEVQLVQVFLKNVNKRQRRATDQRLPSPLNPIEYLHYCGI